MTLVAVLDYEIGNLRSAQKALQHVGADARLTADPALVRDAAAVVLPGVGSFGRCMQALRRTRLDLLAHETVERGVPFLGICIGMQILLLDSWPLWQLALLGAAGGALGQVGDLMESLLKRATGVKDSGRLIPGHGGILDRVDALLVVSPMVYLYALWAG